MATGWTDHQGRRRVFFLCLVSIIIESSLCIPSDNKGGKHHDSESNQNEKAEIKKAMLEEVKDKLENVLKKRDDKDSEAQKKKDVKKGRDEDDESSWKLDGSVLDAFAPDIDTGTDWDFKNNSHILDSPPDDDDEWEQTRPLPRSKTLIDAYLRMHEIVPDVLPKTCKQAVEVVYANSVCVDFGNELTADQVNVMPHRTVWPVEKGAYYTLILLSPDYPDRLNPSESQYVYWFVANIHDTCVTATGNIFTEYLPPTAIWNQSSLHRFVYLVYKQPMGVVAYRLPYTTKHYFDSRKRFNVTEFANDYELGPPVAANLFQMATVRADGKPNKRRDHVKQEDFDELDAKAKRMR